MVLSVLNSPEKSTSKRYFRMTISVGSILGNLKMSRIRKYINKERGGGRAVHDVIIAEM
jgi:hypothetical protein